MILEDFAAVAVVPQASTLDRAQVFDQGYSQGWEDASAAIKADDIRLASRVAAHLESMSHTQQSAMALCLSQVEPLLTELFDRVLPRAADRAFMALILQEAEILLKGTSGQVLAVRVAPETVGPLQSLLDAGSVASDSVRIEAQPGLDPLQARLTHPAGEREVDLARILDAMDDAFEAFRQTERTSTDE